MKTWVTFIAIFTYLVFSADLFAQTLIIDENRFIGGDACFTQIAHSVKTSDDGVVFVGSTQCNNNGDIPPTKSYQQGWNVLIGKLDANRQLLWIKVFGGTDEDRAVSVCETKDGGLVVLCDTKSDDGDVSSHFGTKGIEDIWLIKLDATGNMLWEKTFGSSYSDASTSIKEDGQGNLLLLGVNNGAGDDIPSHHGGQFAMDWVLIKTDSVGNKIWVKVYGGTAEEGNAGSVIVADSNYFIASNSKSTDYNCNDISWFGTTPTSVNAHLLKLDTAGTFIWDKSYGGSSGDGIDYAFFDDRDNSIIAIGFTYSKDYMVPPEAFNNYSWMIKTDMNGDTLWTLALLSDHTKSYQHHSICKGPDGGYLLARDATAKKLGDTTTVSGKTNTNIFAISKSGQQLAEMTFGSFGWTGNDYLGNIIPYKNGYVACGWSSQSKFDKGRNTGNINGQNGGGFLSYLLFWPENIAGLNSKSGALKVFPNPARDKLTIIIPDEYNTGAIVVYNNNGQKIYKAIVEKQKSKINTVNWTSGIYFIRYSNQNNAVITQKIIIEK